ncbi:MAG: DUF3089 domain-containing protein [Lachnospiraceae bacterium]|jgi:hypothetical protein
MKKTLGILSVLIIITLLPGCGKRPPVPAIVKDMNGGAKWNTDVDYADDSNWLALPDKADKDVDVIFFYPASYTKAADDNPEICSIDNEAMRTAAAKAIESQASVFSSCCNIYVPCYRQVSTTYALTVSEEDNDVLLRYSASKDPSRALDYYFENYNEGKPFILAGHSQGSEILTFILADYMKKHPEYYGKMVAAYVIGCSVTKDYMKKNAHLKFAESASDTGVIISYNTEGKYNSGEDNIVVKKGAIAINPLNWKRDDTYAAPTENLGSLGKDGTVKEGFADAWVDVSRGVVVCTTADPARYADKSVTVYGPESYHLHDYAFYYMNLAENARTRIEAFLSE